MKKNILRALLLMLLLNIISCTNEKYYDEWVKDHQEFYHYYDSNGKEVRNKWQKYGEDWYYLNGGGVMQKSKWIDKKYYVDESGKMLHDTQREIEGSNYIFDSNGEFVKIPDYQLVFNCIFPKVVGNLSNWSDDSQVIIENATYEFSPKTKISYNAFDITWYLCAGRTLYGNNYSTQRKVHYKLYDPNNNVIDSDFFYTEVSLKYGEKTKIKKSVVIKETDPPKGVYRLEIY